MSINTPGDWHVSELDATGEKSQHHIFIEPGVAVIERSIGDKYDMADAHLLAASKLLLAALEDAVSDLFLQLEPKHGPEVASKYPSIVKACAAIARARARGEP